MVPIKSHAETLADLMTSRKQEHGNAPALIRSQSPALHANIKPRYAVSSVIFTGDSVKLQTQFSSLNFIIINYFAIATNQIHSSDFFVEVLNRNLDKPDHFSLLNCLEKITEQVITPKQTQKRWMFINSS